MSQSPKHVLVIGGNSGIGQHLVSRLTSAGYSLHLALRDPHDIASPTSPHTQIFDAADPGAVLDLPDSLDALVYLPGTITLKPFHRLTLEDFARDMEVNFFGAVRVIQQALPALKRSPAASSSIVLFGTVAASTGMPFHASIASAKAAVEGLSRSLAAELAPKIRVNAIAPSLTDTPLASHLLATPERAAAAAKRHPLNRIGNPAHLADLAAFLIGESASFITGQTLHADGGLSSLRLL